MAAEKQFYNSRIKKWVLSRNTGRGKTGWQIIKTSGSKFSGVPVASGSKRKKSTAKKTRRKARKKVASSSKRRFLGLRW